MRALSKIETHQVSGGAATNPGEWKDSNNNPYGNMPNPPNMTDFAKAVGEGATIGAYIGGPVGAIEGGVVGGGTYLLYNAGYNAKNYYF